MADTGVNKILLVASSWVGDMVMSHALVQQLAQQNPAAQLHMLAPPATAPLALRMAEICRTHVLDLTHGELGLGRRWRVGRTLRHTRFDEAYILPNNWKSALVPWFAQVPRRVGWHGEMRFGLLTDRRRLRADAYPLMVERFMALADVAGQLPARPYPSPQLTAQRQNAEAVMHRLSLGAGAGMSPITALCPGAEFGSAKKWPPRHYAALADYWLGRGHQIWLFGSAKDTDDCAEIAHLSPGVENLAGKTTLVDAVDLLSLASQAVCNDSGLMHVAAALGVPTIGLYGSTSSAFTPPLGSKAGVVELDLPCRPCFQRECPLGHRNCLQQLQPEQVIASMTLT